MISKGGSRGTKGCIPQQHLQVYLQAEPEWRFVYSKRSCALADLRAKSTVKYEKVINISVALSPIPTRSSVPGPPSLWLYPNTAPVTISGSALVTPPGPLASIDKILLAGLTRGEGVSRVKVSKCRDDPCRKSAKYRYL